MHVLATSVFFAGVVMAQVGNAFACRTETGARRLAGLAEQSHAAGRRRSAEILIAAGPDLRARFRLDCSSLVPHPGCIVWPVLAMFALVVYRAGPNPQVPSHLACEQLLTAVDAKEGVRR